MLAVVAFLLFLIAMVFVLERHRGQVNGAQRNSKSLPCQTPGWRPHTPETPRARYSSRQIFPWARVGIKFILLAATLLPIFHVNRALAQTSDWYPRSPVLFSGNNSYPNTCAVNEPLVFAGRIVVASGKTIMSSIDGRNWSYADLPAGVNESFIQCIGCDRGRIVAISKHGRVIQSFDGLIWVDVGTTNIGYIDPIAPIRIASNGSGWLGVYNGELYSSSDALVWTVVNNGITLDSLSTVRWLGGQWWLATSNVLYSSSTGNASMSGSPARMSQSFWISSSTGRSICCLGISMFTNLQMGRIGRFSIREGLTASPPVARNGLPVPPIIWTEVTWRCGFPIMARLLSRRHSKEAEVLIVLFGPVHNLSRSATLAISLFLSMAIYGKKHSQWGFSAAIVQ